MKLTAKQMKRMERIEKTDEEGNLLLVGYRRKGRSKSAGKEYFLKTPKVIPQVGKGEKK